MKVPYRLRRRAEPAPAAALLLPAHRADELARLVVALELDIFPSVYAVADGFLVRLPRPVERAVPGVVRLRSLADNLSLPADADLAPGLLDDEAADLVRRRGLVFLPGDRVLEFTPQRPLSPA